MNKKYTETRNSKNEINRRDFISGMLVTGAALALSPVASCSKSSQKENEDNESEDTDTPNPLENIGPDGIERTESYKYGHHLWRNEFHAFPAPTDHLYDCIIVGGGISGLAAAWKLQKIGITDFLIVERCEKTGGLCSGDTINGITAARASAYPSLPWNEEMVELYAELGFINLNSNGSFKVNPNCVLKPPYDQIFMDGEWLVEGFDPERVDEDIREDLKEFIEELDDLYQWKDEQEHTVFDCPPDDATEDPKMRGLDNITLGEYVQSKGWSLDMIKIFDPLLRSAYGLGHDRISAWAALDILMDELLPADPGDESLGFPGGNGYFAEKITEKIDAKRILTKTFVTRITEKNGEITLSTISNEAPQTYKARTVIFAVSQFMAPYMLPELSEDRIKAAKSFEYASYIVANVGVSKTPANLAYSNQLVGDFILSDFIVADWTTHDDPLKAPLDRPNILSAYVPMYAIDRKQMLEPTIVDWENRILREFDICLPGMLKTVTDFYLYRWGHAFAVPSKGRVFAPERVLAKTPFGRVLFACADVEGIPTIDHAMTAGFRAAWEVEGMLSGSTKLIRNSMNFIFKK